MNGPGPARSEALRVLDLVRTRVPVAEALAQRTKAAKMAAADRALMTQIVYGVLRNQRFLDAWMEPFLRGELEPRVRDILRMALFQLGFLTRVPAYAVVNAAVEQTKEFSPRATGMVNAILRRAPAQKPENLPVAVEFSHPDWLVRRWERRFGIEQTRNILQLNNQVPPLTLRVNVDRAQREEILESFAQQGVRAEASEYVPEGIRVMGPLWLEDLPAFQSGLLTVQDESGMLATWVLDPQPQEDIVDLTAGLGGKTGHILERTQGLARLTAVDLAASRLHLLQDNLSRLGFGKAVTVVAEDARAFAKHHVHRYDRVLLDAPCSNLGVLRRRSDARWTKRESDLKSHQKMQEDLLDSALSLARPGGVVVYSTCSVEPEETWDVIHCTLAQHPYVHQESVADFLPHHALRDFTVDGALVLTPGDLGMDGFFIARFRT